MITFLLCIAMLVLGYMVYGKIVEKAFGPDDRETPAITMNDGVDFLVMPNWKSFLIQLLNIAGLGPITGAMMGAMWGPVVYIWIVLGSILGGAVHDYMSGMLSIRNKGASLAELVGKYMGNTTKQIMRIFSVFLLLMVGAVFTIGPAGLLTMITPDWLTNNFWIFVILAYYFLATLLPIDKIIGKIYPLFGISLVIMCVGVGVGIIAKGYALPELSFVNAHPNNLPIWPFMFVTVACGAISGFHATQSPLMARCLPTEKKGRQIFYGAMIAEGIIAMVWAAAGVSFYNGSAGLQDAIALGTANGVVYEICMTLLGPVGGALAMIGVVACPISSGDTALRSCRLTLADLLNWEQQGMKKRLAITVPILAISAVIGLFCDYTVVWRYFAWSNQTLAVITLWTIAIYMFQNKKNYFIAVLPAVFMTGVCATYFFAAPECLGFYAKGMLPAAYIAGFIISALLLGVFLSKTTFSKKKQLA